MIKSARMGNISNLLLKTGKERGKTSNGKIVIATCKIENDVHDIIKNIVAWCCNNNTGICVHDSTCGKILSTFKRIEMR